MTNPLAYALDRCAVSSDGDAWHTPIRRRAWSNAILAPLAEYPEQMDLARTLTRGDTSVGVEGPRRGGKTDPIMRWAAAACTIRDNFNVRILSNTLHAPTVNFLARKRDGGLVSILSKCGLLPDVCRVRRVGAQLSIVAIEWPWGSSITVEDIGSTRAIGNKHGSTADFWWIDEATKTPLAQFAITNLIGATLSETGGTVALSYTPDHNLDSLPALIAGGEDTGYQHHWMRPWRNPHFGATFDERWQRLIDGIAMVRANYVLSLDDILRLRALSELEVEAIAKGCAPQHLREWAEGLHEELLINQFGCWVQVAGRYVYYPFHTMPSNLLYWCAADDAHSRRRDGHVLPVATTWEQRIALLPSWEWVEPPQWQIVVAVDIGSWPSAYSEVLKIWAPHYPTVFELHSYKEHKLTEPVMFERLVDLHERVATLQIGGRPVSISRTVADLTGMMVPVKHNWHGKLKKRLPGIGQHGVRAPKKPELFGRRRAHNLDVSNGRMRYIAGSPRIGTGSGGHIDFESRHLRYREDKPAEIHLAREVTLAGGVKVTPRNDALTAGMYADMECRNINPEPPPGARKRGRLKYNGNP